MKKFRWLSLLLVLVLFTTLRALLDENKDADQATLIKVLKENVGELIPRRLRRSDGNR